MGKQRFLRLFEYVLVFAVVVTIVIAVNSLVHRKTDTTTGNTYFNLSGNPIYKDLAHDKLVPQAVCLTGNGLTLCRQ